MEPTENKKFPWLAVIVIVIIVLAGVQWWQTRSSTDNYAYDSAQTASTSTTITPAASSTPSTPVTSASVPPTSTTNSPTNLMHTITLETNKGTIVFETYDADAPKTVENFITLANKKFYDGVIFYRVIKDS